MALQAGRCAVRPVFPIIESKEGRLVSIHGNRAQFFEMIPPDLEQLSETGYQGFFDALSQALAALQSDSYYKFYSIGGKSYLETNSEDAPHFPRTHLKLETGPLETFFGVSEIISGLGIYDDYLAFNGQYQRVLSAIEISGAASAPIIPRGIDYVLSIKKMPKKRAMGMLERIRTGHLSTFLKSKKDIAGESSYQQAENLLGDLIHGEESLLQMELFFIVRDYSLEGLYAKTQEIQATLLGQGIKTFIEGQSLIKAKTGLAQLFSELIPGVRPKLGLRTLYNKATHLRYLLPLNRSHLMDSGIEIHDLWGESIYFNAFEKRIKNRNMLVTGTTGAGKSVFVCKLIHHLASQYPTVILDAGGSFKKLALYHDGVTFSKSINPMQFRDAFYLREFILSVVDQDKFDRLARGKLLKEIKQVLPNVQVFSELLKVLEKEFPGISLYFEDIKDFISDDASFNEKIAYIDIDDYPQAAVAPTIIFILQYFRRIPQKEKILVFDECWSFLAEHAPYIEKCFRTFRKTGALAIAISQGISDFASQSGVGDAIGNNSHFKIYFPQKKIANSDLTDFDWERVGGLQFEKNVFSDCYLKSMDGEIQKVLRIFLSPLELELFNTEAGGSDGIIDFINRFGRYFESNAQAIENFVRLRHDEDNLSFFTDLGKR